MHQQMTRRAALTTLIAASPLALTACQGGVNPLTGPVHVDVVTAQQWSAQVAAAVTQIVKESLPALAGHLSQAQLDTINVIVNGIDAANQAFQTVSSGDQSVVHLVQQISSGVSQLITTLSPLVPAVAAIAPAVQVGLVVLNAFIANIAIVVPPVPASLHRAALRHSG